LTGVKGSGPNGRRTQREGPAESPQEGGRPSTCFAPLGYPRSRKNGGHSEAGAQPCRFTARRATNGAPPSEATQFNREFRKRPVRGGLFMNVSIEAV
jgi:hypothetical protein